MRKACDYDIDQQDRGNEADTDCDSDEEHQAALGGCHRRNNHRSMLEEYGEDPDDYDDCSDSEHSYCDAEAMEAEYLAEDLFSLFRASEPVPPPAGAATCA